MEKFKQSIPGLTISLIVTLLAVLFTLVVSPYPGAVTITIISGIILGNIPFKKIKLDKGALFLEKKVLPLSIALLGAELNFLVLKGLGLSAIFFTILYIILVILLHLILGKIFKFSKKQGLLLGIGNAICGASAIAASSGVIKPKEEELGLSVASVNLAGVLGIFLMPVIAKLLTFEEVQTSALIGTLQAVSQTAASGYSVSEEVGNLALVFKMERVAMLGPLVIILVLLNKLIFKNDTESNTKERKSKISIFFDFLPPFILGFIVIAIIANLSCTPERLVFATKKAGINLLSLSMTGLGMRIKLKALVKTGIKVISAQAIAIFFQITIAIGLIKLFAF